MTGRERVIKAMNFEATDRLPIMANGLSAGFIQWFLSISEDEYWDRQQESHFEAMRRLGQDFHIQFWFPPREAQQWVPGNEASIWTDDDAVAADLERRTAEIYAEIQRRVPNQESHIREIMDYQTGIQNRLGEEILWIFGMDPHGPAICSLPYEIYGYESFFTLLVTQPDVVEAYVKADADLARQHNECVVEAARRLDWPMIGYNGQDLTTQRGNMVNPRTMAQVYFPHLSRAIEPLVDAGFKFIWHSDGNMNEMIGPLIDIGIAGFQGFQEECGTRIADVARLRNRNGDPLILWGSCSVVDVLRTGTLDDVRREVQRVLDEWPHPGLCLATSSYIGSDVPYENIVEFYHLCRELTRGGRGR